MRDDQGCTQTLVDEHGVLWHEIEVRRGDVLHALGAGDWPVAELGRLVDYLRFELLDQAVNEERLIFPLAGRPSDPGVAQLLADHVELRDTTNALADLGSLPEGARDPGLLITMLDDLYGVLDRHLKAEERVLSGASEWGVTAGRRPFRPHQWFRLTEGPVVDADALPREAATELMLERLSRLHPGERVEIRSSARLHALEAAFQRRRMTADYGWAVEEERSGACRVGIVRRPAV